MPRKKQKKDPNEMTDRELLEQVFPKRVVKAIEREAGKDQPDDEPDRRDREP